jgi:hypothetical protein
VDDETSTSISMPTGNARTVAGLMAIAIVFSVISAEIKVVSGAKGTTVNGAFSEPFLIIAGGTIATVILTLISDVGNSGRQFAVGLAGLACVTAVLVNGGPVWKAVNGLLGSKNTAPTGTTAPTTATKG